MKWIISIIFACSAVFSSESQAFDTCTRFDFPQTSLCVNGTRFNYGLLVIYCTYDDSSKNTVDAIPFTLLSVEADPFCATPQESVPCYEDNSQPKCQ